MSKEILKDPMGTRMKSYEKSMDTYIDKNDYFIIRLDGHKFSKFTKIFDRPIDNIFRDAMILTCKQLMDEFKPVFVYTQSDEITMGFLPCENNEEIIYGGRIQKLLSLTSSFASVNLYKNIMDLCMIHDDVKKGFNILGYLDEHVCWFDSRLFVVPSKIEMFNAFLWRQRDCEKNSKAMLSQCYFNRKELHKITAEQMIEKLFIEKKIDWHNYSDNFKFGTLIKKETFEKQPNVIRTRFTTISKKFDFSNDNVELLISKKIN